ncbi:hypothetical protein OKW33_000819 [Paraburkholderia atlantica]|uniref:hypothetical protein n=1 Tax=Paraburkholderia atlantica TaxID=2654982 RepID=UPI003D1B6E76
MCELIPLTCLEYVQGLHRANRVIELRTEQAGRWCSWLFDRPVDLVCTATSLNTAGHSCFVTLNTPRKGIAMLANNGRAPHAMRDADIVARSLMPFDFDPRRPVGVPSTRDEVLAAIGLREQMVGALSKIGWPEPARGMSGNGAHALYRLALPVNAETNEEFGYIYSGLKDVFAPDDSPVDFDTTVRNPSRVLRLYGLKNHKGTATPARPHRIAKLAVPAGFTTVGAAQIYRLANHFSKKNVKVTPPQPVIPKGVGHRGDFTSLDTEAWFRAHDLFLRRMHGGKIAVRCPWASSHTTASDARDSSTVVLPAIGERWPVFKCSHAHCCDRTLAHVAALWGDADMYCAKPWRPTTKAPVLTDPRSS